jgi:hypothetical protein
MKVSWIRLTFFCGSVMVALLNLHGAYSRTAYVRNLMRAIHAENTERIGAGHAKKGHISLLLITNAPRWLLRPYTCVRMKSPNPCRRDCIQFFECFNDGNGAGLGASHQTGPDGLTSSRASYISSQRFGSGSCSRMVWEAAKRATADWRDIAGFEHSYRGQRERTRCVGTDLH